MTITFQTRNPAGLLRRAWVDISIPYDVLLEEGQWLKTENFQTPWFACVGPRVGTHSRLLFLRGQWLPFEKLNGTLIPTDLKPYSNFVPHPWVSDDYLRLFPKPLIQHEEGGPISDQVFEEHFELVEEGFARQVWFYRARMVGTQLVFYAWLYIYTGQPACRLEMSFTNSDPRVPVVEQTWQALGVRAGELFSWTQIRHFGAPHPSSSRDRNWNQVLVGPNSLSDGQQIDFTGWLLCAPEQPVNFAEPEAAQTIQDMVAYTNFYPNQEHRGEVWGRCGEWEGEWGCFKAVPVVNPLVGADPATEYLQWLEFMRNSQSDPYRVTPWGLAKTPGQAGGQEDFGACKGGPVVSARGEPALVERYVRTNDVILRPYHVREDDGIPWQSIDYPNARTWDQRFDTRQPQATYTHGKKHTDGFPPSIQGSQYKGMDEQHFSINNFFAALWLTGSHQLRQTLRDLIQNTLAQYENRAGAPRAVGRLMQSWANMIISADRPKDKQAIIVHLEERMRVVKEQGLWNVSGPVKVLQTGTNVSLREPNGDLVVAWIVWEHAIMARGLYGAALVLEDKILLDKAYDVAKVVTNHGVQYDGIWWNCYTAVRYLDDGVALEPGQYINPIHASLGNGKWWDWILPAVIIFRELEAPTTEAWNRANSIVTSIRPAAGPAEMNTAEWLAVKQF